MTDTAAPTAARRRRTHRWLVVPLAVATVWLAVVTPAAPTAAPPIEAVVPPRAPISAGTISINDLSAESLAQRVPGIGQAYADRIVVHRLLFGPIQGPETLRDLGIPSRVVDEVGPRLRFGT